MLKFTFKEPKGLLYSIDDYFNNWYKDEWFDDELVKQMVLDVDLTEIVSPYLAISPVFGAIPPTKISGGVKTLILSLFSDDIVNGLSCGDNCNKWFIEIGKRKDVVVYMGHPMIFPDKFDAVCIDTGEEIHGNQDLKKLFFKYTDVYEE